MHVAKPPVAAHTPAHLTLVADGKPDAAHQVIGKVTASQGEAFIVRGGEHIPAKAEAPVFQGDAIETQAGSQVTLVFADRETFVLKDKGMLALDEFSYDPAQKTGKATFLLAQGAFTAVSGDLAKTSPDSFRIATPTMVIGVRGTTVSGQVGSDGATSVALLADPGSNFVGEMTLGKLGGGEAIVVNTAGSGVVNATSTSTWSVTPTAAAAVAASAPVAVAPPATAPVLPAAPAATPGGTGQAPGGTGAAQAAAAAAAAPQVAAKAVVASAAPAAAQPAAADAGQGQQGQKAAAAPAAAAEAAAPVADAAPPPPPPAAATGTGAGSGTLGALGASLAAGGTGGTPATGGTGTGSQAGNSSGLFNNNSSSPPPPPPPAASQTNHDPTITGTTNATASDHAGLTTGQISATEVGSNTLTYHIQGGSVLDATHEIVATSHGTVTLNTATGAYVFTPNAGAASLAAGATATDSFTVAVNDGHGGTATANAAVTITGVNDAPTTSVVALGSDVQNTPLVVAKSTLLVNAHDVDGGTLTITGAVTADHGTVVDNGDGTITFTPTASYTGPVTFTYTVDDGQGGTTAGSASLTMTATVNHAPTITSVTSINTASDHAVGGGWATATDSDGGDTITYHLVGGSVVDATHESLVTAHGSVLLDTSNGSYDFTPTAYYLAPGQYVGDSFDVVATDNHGASSAPSTVSVNINGADDPPTVSVTALSTPDDHTGAGATATATDPDTGDTVTFHLVGGSVVDATHESLATTHGSVELNTATGAYAFTPSAGDAALGVGQTATDSFGIVATDSYGLSSAAGNVNVTITGSNDAPTNSGTISLAGGTQDSGSSFAQSLLLANAGDPDTSDVLSISSISVDHGTASLSGGNVNFTPNGGYVGTETFTYTIGDGHGGSVQGHATMTIAPISNLTLTGSGGGDTLTGGAGNDTFYSAVGADTMIGGGGADLFVLTSPTQSQDATPSRDVITDFATGVDHIKLSLSGTHVDVSTFAANAGSYNSGQATLAGGGVVGDGFYSSLDQALYIYVTGTTTDIGADGGYVIGSANQINAADLQFVITGTAGSDTLIGGVGNDTIIGGGGGDTIHAGGGDDQILMATGDLAGSTIDGGTGYSHLVLTDAGAVGDAAFTNITNMTGGLVVHDGDVLTLGAHWQASGMSSIDATATTGAVTVDASGTTGYAELIAGSGAEVFIGGNDSGAIDTVAVSTAALGNDTITGGNGTNVINLTDAGTVTDLAFAHISHMTGGSVGTLQMTDGDTVVLGANSQAAGINYVSAYNTTGTEVIDASARTDTVTLQAGSGHDTLIAGTGSDLLIGDTNNIGSTTFVPNATGGIASINNYLPSTSGFELDDSQFHLGTSGTLTSANYASDANSANTISSSAHDFSTGVHNAGVVAINDGASGATLWYTSDMAAATTANSHEFAHVNNVNTTALDATQFHLHV